jgi:putative DNA primase/helicase
MNLKSTNTQNDIVYSSHDTDLINKLKELTPIAYDRVRTIFAKEMGIRPATLDSIIKREKTVPQEDEKSPFPEITPWHEPVDPGKLLTDISNTIKRFIVCNNETVIAATLWAAMTWFIDVIQIAPLAVITAPEKRCGKSQLLFLFSQIVKRPLAASNISPAALFRSIDAWQPTLLIDEVDTFMRENNELRGLINAGHTRTAAFIYRTTGENHTLTQFNLWGAKALAGIGKLNDTLMDRSIILSLRRKLPSEQAERLRYAEPGLFKQLAAKLARFSSDYTGQILAARPQLPETLSDRAQDNWEPLLAIADIAQGNWSHNARTAALKISGDIESSQSIGTELLSDIQDIIETMQTDRISSADLIKKLCEDPEKPWATFNHGHSISPRQIASRLREFGISSTTIRLHNTTAKGYLFIQFADVFNRYLSPDKGSSVTASQSISDGS